MTKNISINGCTVGIGETKEVHLNIARLPTYTPIELSVNVFRGEEDGPVLLLTGGIHGDEINGVEIIRRMIASGQITPAKGTVIAIPLVNIYGFIQKQRDLPDGKDINRSFPGSRGGSLARLVANALMEEIFPCIDAGIDFHTGGSARANYPQLRCSFKVEENRRFAAAFAAPVTINSSLIDQSFRKAAHKKGKSILVFETGEANRFDQFGIRIGINGTLRLMKFLGMNDHAPESTGTDIYQKTTWKRAGSAGLFHHEVELGDKIRKNEILGYISDPFGHEWFKVKSPQSGRVIGLNNAPVIHKGDALLHIAYNAE
jgi:predicted deacylase